MIYRWSQPESRWHPPTMQKPPTFTLDNIRPTNTPHISSCCMDTASSQGSTLPYGARPTKEMQISKRDLFSVLLFLACYETCTILLTRRPTAVRQRSDSEFVPALKSTTNWETPPMALSDNIRSSPCPKEHRQIRELALRRKWSTDD